MGRWSFRLPWIAPNQWGEGLPEASDSPPVAEADELGLQRQFPGVLRSNPKFAGSGRSAGPALHSNGSTVAGMDDTCGLELDIVGEDADGSTPGTVYRLVAAGEIDLASAHRLSEAVEKLIDRGANTVVVDATKVEFMDSSGLRAIVQCDKALSAVGGRLMIDGMTAAVRQVLEISSLIDHYSRDRPGGRTDP